MKHVLLPMLEIFGLPFEKSKIQTKVVSPFNSSPQIMNKTTSFHSTKVFHLFSKNFLEFSLSFFLEKK